MNLIVTPEQIAAAKALVAALAITVHSYGEDADEAAELLFVEDKEATISVMFGILITLVNSVCELTSEDPVHFVQRLGINVAEAATEYE